MITTRTLYEVYFAFLKERINILNNEIAIIKINIDKVSKILEPYENTLDKLLDIDSFLLGNIAEIPKNKCITREHKYINVQVKLYYGHCNEIKRKIKEINNINKQVINYDIFLFIINNFNDLLTDRIVYDKYEFSQNSIGSLSLVLYTQKKKQINWGETDRNREKLLKEGKVLYNKENAELAKLENKVYEGVPYISYFPIGRMHLYMNWNPNPSGARMAIPNIGNYSFTPTRGNNSCSRKILNHRKSLTDEQLKTYKVL